MIGGSREGRGDLGQMRARSAELFESLHGDGLGEAERSRYRDELVHLHLPLVEHFARRFLNRGEPFDDLLQVGTIGLIKAIDRFDTERGVEFSTYATPTIVGEIKRHFRDRGWAIRVPRRLQELRISISTATAELSQEHGRSPTVTELAHSIGVSDEDIIEGLESSNAYSTLSLDARESGDDSELSMIDVIGGDDEAMEHVENRETIKPLLEALDPREKHILDPAVLPWHDPVPDRRRDRNLSDARLPAAGANPRAAPRLPRRAPTRLGDAVLPREVLFVALGERPPSTRGGRPRPAPAARRSRGAPRPGRCHPTGSSRPPRAGSAGQGRQVPASTSEVGATATRRRRARRRTP